MKNFGKLKNKFNEIMVEGMVSKDNKKKKLFKEYTNSIKKNRILKEQFLVYSNIETKCESDRSKAREYVQANIDALKKHVPRDIIEANIILAQPILFEQEVTETPLIELHENITKLIFTENTIENVDILLDAMDCVVEHITKNKARVVNEGSFLPTSVLSSLTVEKFNEKYGHLSEDEKKVLKSIMESDDNGKKELLNSLTRECIDLVDGHISESDTDTKEKLLTTKDRLLRVEYVEESFITDISKLITLKSDLNE
jgi:hypothetical protein